MSRIKINELLRYKISNRTIIMRTIATITMKTIMIKMRMITKMITRMIMKMITMRKMMIRILTVTTFTSSSVAMPQPLLFPVLFSLLP